MMTVLALALYLLGTLAMMCLVEIEMRGVETNASPGARMFAIAVASLLWPLIMLYAVVGIGIDGFIHMGLRLLGKRR